MRRNHLIDPNLNPKEYSRFYRGWSMSGTFHPGECLWMVPVPLAEIRRGDVVIFRKVSLSEGISEDCVQDADNPIGEVHTLEVVQAVDELVHRVIAIQPGGLVTRGDHNPCNDPDLVTKDNLVGRVVYVERDGKLCKVFGGIMGMFHASLLRVWFTGLIFMKRVGKKPYQFLRRSGFVRIFWHPRFSRVRLMSEDGPLVKFTYRGCTVAHWWPQQGCFRCRVPFDLVLRREDLQADEDSPESSSN